ncbi:hypothetical protein [Streptomyces sp. SID12501]|uniref:Uncharacterized protein n=1 Tax=Streptomyces sp. SID12501 TaxID=2706042 RepID=A0A6B3BWH6_9ACTN|nr:hypothetical protein [Streptomyces sp. SID12501]NEC88734.1 hypothetical protein [Streptomyces sp. SID12501]
MNRNHREGGWRSGAGRRQVSSNVKAGNNNVIQSTTAGGDVSNVSQSVSPPADDTAVAEVRASLREFRDVLSRLGAGQDRDAGLRAADRIEGALDNPEDQRDTIEGAADTIGLIGRTVSALAGAATAVQQAVTALF